MKKGSLKRRSSKMIFTLVLALVLCLGSAISTFAISGEWKQDSTGWWFKKTDGSYPKSSWQEINSKWYYFDETGYIVTSEYREGYWVGADGAWVTAYKGGNWKSDKKGKWYTDNSGWYPVSAWLKIDGKWYYFDKTGYLVTKQWVDNCYVGEDGAWIPNAKKMDYSGKYVDTFAGRAVVTVKKLGDSNQYSISVSWPNSAYQTYEWYMTGEMDATGTLKYKDGTKTAIEYDKTGGSTSKNVYTKLTGTIKIEDDVLTWTEDKENVAKGNEFKKSEEVKVTGKDYSGKYIESVAKRAYVEIKATANDYFEVYIRWPDSAAVVYEYNFTGTFDKDGVLKYTDGTKTKLEFDEKGNGVTTSLLKNGSGSISINEKGELKWTNNNEYIAEKTVFIFEPK